MNYYFTNPKYERNSQVKYKDEVSAQVERISTGFLIKSDSNLLAYADIGQLNLLSPEVKNGELLLTGTLAAHSKERLLVYIPSWDMTLSEVASLNNKVSLIENVESYWKEVLTEGINIQIPDTQLENVINASMVNCLIATRNDKKGKVFIPWSGAAWYGALESESHAIIYGMDLMGHHDFARRSLDFFIDQYKPQGSLTTGYTLMGMGQHLWTLGEHFKLCNDHEWLKGHSSQIAKACEWIIRHREKTKKNDGNGKKLPEYGLMPPGVAADWPRFAYRFVLEGYFYAGLKNAADSLAGINYPGADLLVADSCDFRQQIRRAYHWTQAKSTVLELTDGTWVPYYPGMLYCFGEIGDAYKGEDVGRAWCYDVELGAHHLIPLGVLGKDEKDVQWITNHMEDVWFLKAGWSGYPQEEVDKDWFNMGGFSKVQPYYCRIAQIYAMTDDVKPFIRTYFNSLATLLNQENLSLWEHLNGGGGWNKTHETGWFLSQSRTMFVMERDNDLWLAPFITNQWMKNGMEVKIDNASTQFGPVSYNIRSFIDEGYIEAVIRPDFKSSPKNIFIRLRHPNEKRITKVTVNGKIYKKFNAEKEYVELAPSDKTVIVRAEY